MSTRRRRADWFDNRLLRRSVTIAGTVVAAVVGILLSPALLVAAAITDLVGRRRRFPRVRLVALVIGALVIETIGLLIVGLGLWIVTGFGLLGSAHWRWHRYRSFMGWYTRSMLALIVTVLGTEIVWRDHADLSTGPVVLVARHTSFFDALIPATVLSQRNRLLAHHIVTHGLRYAPCIDIVGHRLPNRFIKRDPGEGSSELGPIQAIGAVLDARSAGIIFPEGTFRTEDRFERAVRRIGRRDPELAARAAGLHYVLPPRSNGTHALLAGAPEADVVVCANTGFEPFGSIKDIVDYPVSDRAVVVETWRIPRRDVPDDPERFGAWLLDRYVEIDDWVTAARAEP